MELESSNRNDYPKRNCVNTGELRMGNWVQHSGSGKPFIWTLEKFWEYYVAPDKSYYYDPIPLTPEILEKAGWVKDYNGYDHPSKISFAVTKDGEYMACWQDRAIRVIPDLHSLMNLYHSLTSKEIDIIL
jgi:hypothetical protein